MHDHGDQGDSDELRQRAEELKQKAFEEEARRLELEAEKRARDLTKRQLSDDAEVFQEKRQEVDEEKRREELKMTAAEDEVLRVLELERQKRFEARRREELELKRREMDEQRHEEERKAQEELARRRAEEEQIRRESEEERKREAEKKRSELETLRRDQERLRREVERQERIQTLLQTAESFYASGNYEHAAIEVAKALVNDPAHPDILALDQKVKEAQEKGTAAAVVVEEKLSRSVTEAPQLRKTPSLKPEQKSKLFRYIAYGIFTSLVVVAVFVLIHFKKRIFPTPIKVVVIPWTLASNSPEENLVATGLAAELSTLFEQLKPVMALGTSSVYNSMQTSKDPAQAAFRLGYPYVIQGSFSHTGDNLFANLQLVDSTGAILWSRQFVKSNSSLSQLPREVFADVMGTFRTLTDESLTHHSVPTQPIASDAYILYLEGLAQLYGRSAENVRQALDLFMKASLQDQQFAEARAAAAKAILFQLERGWDTSRSSFSIAKNLAQEAVKIDSSLGSAYCALGEVLTQEGKYDEAIQQLDRALELTPRSSDVQLSRAITYFKIGKYNELMDAMARAYELNPLDTYVLTTYASMHQLTGTARQGIAYHEIALTLVADSTSYLIGPVADEILSDPSLSLIYSSRVGAAFQRRLRADSSDYTAKYGLARMLQVTGQAADATDLLMKLESRLKAHLQLHPRDVRAMVLMAKTLTRLGKFPEATELAKQALKIDPGSPEVRYRIAQVYSLQMYSQKNNAIDEKKKSEALQALRNALAHSFRLDELTNADFYNMYEQSEFRSVLQGYAGL
ncbi:MAG: tetratricopeptide repeat protein [Ignavibacteria bacterium]|nr:tetratricopeptide repeat protein [Ignavibacteria bacterium]